jgi:hypothetical protein
MTGFKLPLNLGYELVLKGGNNPNSNTGAITPGWFLPLRLPDGAGDYTDGADDFREAIGTCIGNPVVVNPDDPTYLPTENGAMVGPTGQGFGDLHDLDPTATWNSVTKRVENSCAPVCAPFSPRIVPLPVFDMDEFQWRRAQGDWSVCPGGGRCVKIVNILGFFASHMSGQDVVGYLMTYPGKFVPEAPMPDDTAGFLKVIQLIR